MCMYVWYSSIFYWYVLCTDWVAGCILYVSSVYYLYSTVLVCVYLGD